MLGIALALLCTAAAAAPETPAEPKKDDAPEPALGTVVTGTRLPRPVRDVPVTVVVLPRAEIDRSPSLTTDLLVRAVPSAATFRRSGSLVSDPSAQGLNLRGLGPSGVSRALVLVDGVPVNDPFGGWIYWRALPRLGLDRIEVAPGGGSALYGNHALGGVVQLFSRPIDSTALEADALGGSYGTFLLAGRAAHVQGPLGAAVEAELLGSDGFAPIARPERGPIDRAAPSSHATVDGRIEWTPSAPLRLAAQVGYFEEAQNGGTGFTDASVRLSRAAMTAQLALEGGGSLDGRVFARAERFGQTRARIATGRVSEALAGRQDVPCQDVGGSLAWTSAPISLLGKHVLTAGADVQRIVGRSDEQLFPAALSPSATLFRSAGGEQLFGGLFAQDLYSVAPSVELQLDARVDGWRNREGFRDVTLADGTVDSLRFEDGGALEVSPRAALLLKPFERVGVRASAYRAFRAPTLNELYRPFQVGTVLTAANEALKSETVLGGELGASWGLAAGIEARVTGFWNELQDPISNVTLEAPLPDGARRQRQNLGAARVRGVEISAEARLARGLGAVLSYTFVDSAVTQAPGNPELVGKQLAQDPAHRAALLLSFDHPSLLTATAQLRWVGPQFEDDLNQLPMGGYVVIDASVGRRILPHLELFAAVENLLNRTYLVGRAGIDTVGQPFMARVGIRLREAR